MSLYRFFVQPYSSTAIGDALHLELVFEARNDAAAIRQAKRRLRRVGAGKVAQVLDAEGALIWMDVAGDTA